MDSAADLRPAGAITVEIQEEFCCEHINHSNTHAVGQRKEDFWGWKREETSSMSGQGATHAHLKKAEHMSELIRGLSQESARMYSNAPRVSDYSHDCSAQNQVDDFFCITLNEPVGNVSDNPSSGIEPLHKTEFAYPKVDEEVLDSSEGDSHCNASTTHDSEDSSSQSAISPGRERDLDAMDYFACDSDSSCERQRESSGMYDR